MAYERPQVTVDQNITITPTSIERDQPAFIFGPNYELHRYDNADEKAKTAIGAYTGSSLTEEYPNVIDGEAVDTTYTKVVGDNVVTELVNLNTATLPERNAPAALRAEKGGYSKLLFENKIYVDHDSATGNAVTRDSSLPQNLAVGDVLRIVYKHDVTEEEIVLLSKITAVEYRSDGFDLFDSSTSAMEGAKGTMVTIDDAIVEGVDLDSAVTVKLVTVESGVVFTAKNLADGTGFQWEQGTYTASSGETFYGVKVNELNAFITNYFTDATSVADGGKYCPVVYADLYVTYRELLTTYSDTFHSVVGATAVENLLGKVDRDNPLAMGVYMAALNAATDDGDEASPVYFMAVPTDNLSGYNAVLNKATLTDVAYVFAPTTRDEAVLEAVRNHVLEMSAKTVKMWRIGAASAEIPDEVCKLDAAMDPQGDNFLAIPISDTYGMTPGGADYSKFRVVKSATDPDGNTDTAFNSTLVKDDKVRFCYRKNAWSEEVYDEYSIKKVVNNYTVEIDTTDGCIDVSRLVAGTSCYGPVRIEIYHPYTKDESAEQIAKISKRMASRRMINVFPSVFKMDGVLMTGEFAACAVAGLVSATEPQQPITNVTVRGIDDIPLVYQSYNKTQLDTMAAGGTFIVAQDIQDDNVYVRHQITTAYPDGNLNTAELSITKNIDSISYAFAETFRPYYGKYNITPGLLAILANLASQLINQFGGSSSVYGPQLITDETEIKYIRQNELMKDHVDVAITLGVPYPCNNIDIVLTV